MEDKRVPVKQSRMLVSELQKSGKPYEYVEQKYGDHHFSRADDRLEFLKRLKAFLDKHNPARSGLEAPAFHFRLGACKAPRLFADLEEGSLGQGRIARDAGAGR
jgi:prolyl oligopeptidase family protein